MEKFLQILAFDICDQSGILKALQIIGFALTIIKVVVPILLVIMGTFELGKAVIANDDKAIKTAVNSLIKKAIAGVVIFFLPTIIAVVASLVDELGDLNKFTKCTNCLTNPSDCKLGDSDGIFE